MIRCLLDSVDASCSLSSMIHLLPWSCWVRCQPGHLASLGATAQRVAGEGQQFPVAGPFLGLHWSCSPIALLSPAITSAPLGVGRVEDQRVNLK